MEKSIQLMLEKAQDEAQKGKFQAAYTIYKKALNESKGHPGEILFEMGAFLFANEQYGEALEKFIECHHIGYQVEKVEEIIFEAYYEPNIEDFKQKYEANKIALMKYIHISITEYPDFTDLHYRFIPYSDFLFAVYDCKVRKFISNHYNLRNQQHNFNGLNKDSIILFKDEYSQYTLLTVLDKTSDPKPFLWQKAPVYLYYEDCDEFVQYLQVCDFPKILESERLVFLLGKNELKTAFLDPQLNFPQTAYNTQGQESFVSFLKSLLNKRNSNTSLYLKEADEYYNNLEREDLLEHINSGKIKIMFITTRFSTAIQYYIRDLAEACDRLSISNRTLIEKSNVHRVTEEAFIEFVSEYKPDIILIIGHFRWENSWKNENVIYITWIQDQLPHIMSKESPPKLKDLDFLLNTHVTAREIFDIGYPEEKMIDLPVFANGYVYRSYDLTSSEKEKYSTDICIISNPGNPDKGLEIFLSYFRHAPYYNSLQVAIKSAYDETYRRLYHGEPMLTADQCNELLHRWFDEYRVDLSEDIMIQTANAYRYDVAAMIYRSIIVEWLHERGYKLKLWGNAWVKHPRLQQYAMGVAKNGETLSKILNASKISIGLNPLSSTHPRVFETILSNCLYMANNIPIEEDWADIRKFFIEGEEIVIFYGKEDLYEKIDYYLENEDRREKVIHTGKKKTFEKWNYEASIKRIMDHITKNIAKNID